MGDKNYQYPVALILDQEIRDQGAEYLRQLRIKLELYFGKKESNGGECEIRQTEHSREYILIYFKEKGAQKRVLEKNLHQVILNDGSKLKFRVVLPKASDERSMGNNDSKKDRQNDHGASGYSGDAGKGRNKMGDSTGSDHGNDTNSEQSTGKGRNMMGDSTGSDYGNDTNSGQSTDHQQGHNQNSGNRKRTSSSQSDPELRDEGSKRVEDDSDKQRERGKYSDNVSTLGGKGQDSHSAQTSQRENEENNSSAISMEESRGKSLTRGMSTEEPGNNRPADLPEIFWKVTAKLDKKLFPKALRDEIKAEFQSLTIEDKSDFVMVEGTYDQIKGVHQYLQGNLGLSAEKPSDTPSEGSLADTNDQLCLTSPLYEYIMEIYRTDVENLQRRYRVKIEHHSNLEGSTYVRFIPQGSESSPDKAKESFTDKVQKVTGDWSQEKMDCSVVPLTFSDIKQQVTDRWSKILVLQEETHIIFRGPKDDLSEVMKFFLKGDHKPTRRPRRTVTISSDMRMEIPVDVRHMDILRKLKNRQISDIEQKYNVKMEEQEKNGSLLITFRAINAPPDLSPHATHSFITLLQKTFFNIEKKQISVKPEFQGERVGILQEELMMGGVDLVMEYSSGSVLLIGHPVHVAFAEEKLSGNQNPGRGQAASDEAMDTSASSVDREKTEEPDKCPICLCEMEDKDKVLLEKCKHAYCKGCLKELMARKPVCAICGVSYGTIRGDQPDGTMRETMNRNYLSGYPRCGTIEITYSIPGGIQTENHPHPGRHFSGAHRTAYLPDNSEGRDILRLLKKAFDQRLIFTVGDSRTSGATDTVTWNDIHHKTSMTGGPHNFGYPDPDYLRRVRDELKAKGIE